MEKEKGRSSTPVSQKIKEFFSQGVRVTCPCPRKSKYSSRRGSGFLSPFQEDPSEMVPEITILPPYYAMNILGHAGVFVMNTMGYAGVIVMKISKYVPLLGV